MIPALKELTIFSIEEGFFFWWFILLNMLRYRIYVYRYWTILGGGGIHKDSRTQRVKNSSIEEGFYFFCSKILGGGGMHKDHRTERVNN